ncbi:MAG TPA: FtsQ-type POTRA domain-containing protein, partial [Firmicutes bacterium]|nr:FtsQ-type POTRA domain-containing protein [Bacillota bacterium]
MSGKTDKKINKYMNGNFAHAQRSVPVRRIEPRRDSDAVKHIIKKKQLRQKHRSDSICRFLATLGFLAIYFHATTTDWPHVRHVDVRGEARLSKAEVISLASLDDTSRIWTPFIPREQIARTLEKNPLIERADISITGLFSIRIDITERRSVGALEINGFRLAFDRTGEMIEIIPPSADYHGQTVMNVHPGFLRVGGFPLHLQSEAWAVSGNHFRDETQLAKVAKMETRFAKVIRLMQYIASYGGKFQNHFDRVEIDDEGSLIVFCIDRPPVILGKFDYPEQQFRRLLAVVNDEVFGDTERISCIDLSSLEFPHYHVRDKFFTREELIAIETWLINAETAEEESSQDEENEEDSEEETFNRRTYNA